MNVFAIRHGETVWSLSGQHTGVTDIPLTDNGRRLAERMRPVRVTKVFELVLCSPMQRARETCQLAGLGDRAIIDSDLVERNSGDYEGLTPKQINEAAPGWLIFRDGCPGGETPEQVGARVDRVIARTRAVAGNTALFAHGHLLRVFAARWIGLPAGGGQHFLLNPGTLSLLGYYHEIAAVRIWNGPLLDGAASFGQIRKLDPEAAGHTSGLAVAAEVRMSSGVQESDPCRSRIESVSAATSTTPSFLTSTAW